MLETPLLDLPTGVCTFFMDDTMPRTPGKAHAVCGCCVWLLCVSAVCECCVWLLCVAAMYECCVWLLCVAAVCGCCV